MSSAFSRNSDPASPPSPKLTLPSAMPSYSEAAFPPLAPAIMGQSFI